MNTSMHLPVFKHYNYYYVKVKYIWIVQGQRTNTQHRAGYTFVQNSSKTKKSTKNLRIVQTDSASAQFMI